MRTGKMLWAFVFVLLQMSCQRGESNTPPVESNTKPVAATTRSATENQRMEDKLMGSWVANDVDAKLGEVKIKLTFRKEGPMKLAAWSDIPFAGQVRDKTAPYEVHGDVISSDAIRGGTSVTYWFEGEQLVIRYKEGKTVAFHRP